MKDDYTDKEYEDKKRKESMEVNGLWALQLESRLTLPMSKGCVTVTNSHRTPGPHLSSKNSSPSYSHSSVANPPGTVHIHPLSASSPQRLMINPFSLEARNLSASISAASSPSTARSSLFSKGVSGDVRNSKDVIECWNDRIGISRSVDFGRWKNCLYI